MKRRTFLGAATASLAVAQLTGSAHATSPTAGSTAGQYTIGFSKRSFQTAV